MKTTKNITNKCGSSKGCRVTVILPYGNTNSKPSEIKLPTSIKKY